MKLQSLCRFLAAGDEPGFVGVDLETSFSQELVQGSVGQNGFPRHIVGVRANNVEGDIIYPGLQGGCRLLRLAL